MSNYSGSNYSGSSYSGGSQSNTKAPPTVRRPFFRRQKACPFSGAEAQVIDYKNARLLQRFVSERGKIMPCRISSVSTKKQRELATAIKRARFLGLLTYSGVH